MGFLHYTGQSGLKGIICVSCYTVVSAVDRVRIGEIDIEEAREFQKKLDTDLSNLFDEAYQLIMIQGLDLDATLSQLNQRHYEKWPQWFWERFPIPNH